MPADNKPSRTLNGRISRKGTQPAKRRVTNRAGRTHQHPDSEAKARLRRMSLICKAAKSRRSRCRFAKSAECPERSEGTIAANESDLRSGKIATESLPLCRSDQIRSDQIRKVPGVGLEPTRPFGQRILNPSRLPIPPSGLDSSNIVQDPGVKPLQASSVPTSAASTHRFTRPFPCELDARRGLTPI